MFDALKDFKGHPSAEEVYLLVKKRNPRVALGTVYQALSVLEEIGLIEAKRWTESPVRYDLNTAPTTTSGARGAVRSRRYRASNSRTSRRALGEHHLRVTNASLVIEGVCPPGVSGDGESFSGSLRPRLLAALAATLLPRLVGPDTRSARRRRGWSRRLAPRLSRTPVIPSWCLYPAPRPPRPRSRW